MKMISTCEGQRWEKHYKRYLKQAVKLLPAEVKKQIDGSVIFVIVTKDYYAGCNNFEVTSNKGDEVCVITLNFPLMRESRENYIETTLHEIGHLWNQHLGTRDTERRADFWANEWINGRKTSTLPSP